MLRLFFPILVVAATISALPVREATVRYDQRQEGELNVRADLQNFVVLIVPTPSANLMNLFRFVSPLKGLSKRRNSLDKTDTRETENFIESKTAPYRVDLTKDAKDKLRPDVEKNAEMLAGRSPPITQLDEKEDSLKELHRFARAYIVSIPNELEQTEAIDGSPNEKTSKIKEKLLLLGSMFEQCGPDSRRDERGICRLLKKK